MSPRLRLLLFVCGAGVFTYLVARIGVATLLADAARTGWMFVPILALCGLAYVCNSWAWRLMMADQPSRPSFWRTFAITVSGFSMNFMTPFVNLGGEPFKVAALAPWVGTRQAAGAVVLYQMLHTLAMLLTYLLALGLALFLLPLRAGLVAALVLAAAVLVALTLLLFAGHRRGVLERALNVLHRLPLLSRGARLLEPWRGTLVEMDEQIIQFYHRDRRRFFQALGLECVARCLVLLEFWVIVLTVGVHAQVVKVFAVGGLEGLIGNVLFVFPYELGTKESALYILFPLIGLSQSLGVYAAVVSRVRDIAWIGCGLLLVVSP